MTAQEFLQALKTRIDTNVAKKIELMTHNPDSKEPTYVNPYVSLITLPHKNFVAGDFLAPFMLIGLQKAVSNYEEHTLTVKITFATYGGSYYSSEFYNNDIQIFDDTGYIDLINLIELTKLDLMHNSNIDGMGIIENDFEYGVYDEEITYPFTYGYLIFNASLPITNDIRGII